MNAGVTPVRIDVGAAAELDVVECRTVGTRGCVVVVVRRRSAGEGEEQNGEQQQCGAEHSNLQGWRVRL